jgi:hypothetical protein
MVEIQRTARMEACDVLRLKAQRRELRQSLAHVAEH